jgi:hypothetical protein
MTGNDNIAIGYNAGIKMEQSANRNILIGSYAGDGQTVADDMVFIGHNTGTAVATNAANGAVAVGSYALSSLGSGEHNIAIGYKALEHTDTGTDNIAIGYQALGDKDVGGSGHAADSDHNIAIGTNAMGGAWADAKSENNIAIGSNVMDAVMNDADHNTGIGYDVLWSASFITASITLLPIAILFSDLASAQAPPIAFVPIAILWSESAA